MFNINKMIRLYFLSTLLISCASPAERVDLSVYWESYKLGQATPPPSDFGLLVENPICHEYPLAECGYIKDGLTFYYHDDQLISKKLDAEAVESGLGGFSEFADVTDEQSVMAALAAYAEVGSSPICYTAADDRVVGLFHCGVAVAIEEQGYLTAIYDKDWKIMSITINLSGAI